MNGISYCKIENSKKGTWSYSELYFMTKLNSSLIFNNNEMAQRSLLFRRSI